MGTTPRIAEIEADLAQLGDELRSVIHRCDDLHAQVEGSQLYLELTEEREKLEAELAELESTIIPMTDAEHEARIAAAQTRVELTQKNLKTAGSNAQSNHDAAIDAYQDALEAYINHLRGKPSK